MILVLSRGGFCPKDHQQRLELAANYPKIRVSYTQIVTISTDNILKTNEFRDSVGAPWTFLSDAGRNRGVVQVPHQSMQPEPAAEDRSHVLPLIFPSLAAGYAIGPALAT